MISQIEIDYPYHIQAHAVLGILNSIAQKYKKGYSYPSQEHILRLLARFYGIAISRRTLNRWLRVIEDCQYIQRVRRIRKLKNGQLRFNSTLYKLKRKAYVMLGATVRKLGGWGRKNSKETSKEGERIGNEDEEKIESGRRLGKEEMLDLVRKYNRG